MASGCRLSVAYSAVMLQNPPESNWHLTASCHLSIQLLSNTTLSNRIGIWLPVISCRFARTDELATSCLLPVAYSPVILYNSEIELTSDSQLSVANSQDFLKNFNWHLAAVCHLPILLLCSKTLSNQIGI